MPIDPKLIDVDFDNEPNECGLIEETDDQVAAAFGPLASFADDYPELMVPRAKRREIAREKWALQKKTKGPTQDQKRTSACVGFGAAKALTITNCRRYGKKFYFEASGMDVYKDIGRSLMSGAMISDGMRRVANPGALPVDNAENRAQFELVWSNNSDGYYARRPAGWKDKIPFRVSKFATCRGEDEIESALVNDLVGIVGRSRHCVPYFGLAIDNGNPYSAYANSWGSNWGDDGIGYDSLRTYRNLTMYVILEVAVPDYLDVPNL